MLHEFVQHYFAASTADQRDLDKALGLLISGEWTHAQSKELAEIEALAEKAQTLDEQLKESKTTETTLWEMMKEKNEELAKLQQENEKLRKGS